MKIPRPKKGTLKLCGFFVDYPWKFHALSDLLHEIPCAITSTHIHPHVLVSLIQKDVWTIMTSSEWELYVAANLWTNFKHLKWVNFFSWSWIKNQLTSKISNEERIAIANIVELNNMSSNLKIVILLLITKLILRYKSL